MHTSIRCRHQEIITIKRFDVGKDFTTCGWSNLKVLPSGIEIYVKIIQRRMIKVEGVPIKQT